MPSLRQTGTGGQQPAAGEGAKLVEWSSHSRLFVVGYKIKMSGVTLCEM